MHQIIDQIIDEEVEEEGRQDSSLLHATRDVESVGELSVESHARPGLAVVVDQRSPRIVRNVADELVEESIAPE